MPRTKTKSAKKKTRLKGKINPRQLLVVKKLSENVRKKKGQKGMSIGKIMREAGYSPETSKKPYRLTRSKGFQQLLEEYLPDDMIAKAHQDLFNAHKVDHYVFPASVSDDWIKKTVKEWGFKLTKIAKNEQWKRAYYSMPDHAIRTKGIQEAYKIKNKYPAEKHDHRVGVFNFDNWSDEELKKYADEGKLPETIADAEGES